MPCNDIRETILVRLDLDERISAYHLNKLTCGADVGDPSLLLDLVSGARPEEVLAFPPHQLPTHLEGGDPTLEFLAFKHLFALQAALRVFTGVDPGNPTAECTVAKIVNDFAGIEFHGVLDSAPILERIKACGQCGTCGRSGD